MNNLILTQHSNNYEDHVNLFLKFHSAQSFIQIVNVINELAQIGNIQCTNTGLLFQVFLN